MQAMLSVLQLQARLSVADLLIGMAGSTLTLPESHSDVRHCVSSYSSMQLTRR